MKVKAQLLILIGAVLLMSALTMFVIGELAVTDATIRLGLRIAAGADLLVGLGFLLFGVRRLGESGK